MYSMTGYGKAEGIIEKFHITIEIKSVNNRYLDINFRAPANVLSFEPTLREIVKRNVKRGKINVLIDLKENLSADNGSGLNNEKLTALYNKLKTIKEKFKLSGNIELGHILQFQELFEPDISTIEDNIHGKELEKIFKQALDTFNLMRRQEGQHLITDMNNRIDIIKDVIDFVRENSKDAVKEEFAQLTKRIDELIENKNIDKERMEQEIALLSDKVDITEEITRLESHLKQFRNTLKRESELGKKLTFILQEMHREANTINAKTTKIEVSHKIIQVKEEIEKIREQAQNIE